MLDKNPWNHLTVCKQISSDLLKKLVLTNYLFTNYMFNIYLYKHDLALSNPLESICHKFQHTNQPGCLGKLKGLVYPFSPIIVWQKNRWIDVFYKIYHINWTLTSSAWNWTYFTNFILRTTYQCSIHTCYIFLWAFLVIFIFFSKIH